MEDFFYKGIWRMDWGLGNPNKTATLIATLMAAVWVLAFIRFPFPRHPRTSNVEHRSSNVQPWGFWSALLLFTGLGVCLIHTFSRGGVLAAFAGLIPLMIYSRKPWAKSKVIALMISVWVIVGFSIIWEVHERYSQKIGEDRSITHRLELWKVAPRMMVDAPTGWGLGNSGKAYMQWYQPLDRSEEYRTLVNSHFTWLVEFGWPMRFLYVLAWFSVLTLCWPTKEHHKLAIPFGIWTTFAVAAWFSSIAESPWLWFVPSASLVIVLAYRIHCKVWPRLIIWLVPIGAAVILIGGLFILGKSRTEIHGSRDRVIVGEGEPQVWVVVDTKALSNNYGKALRKFFQSAESKQETVALVNSATSLGDISGKTVILPATLSKQEKMKVKTVFALANKVILVNPLFFPQDLSISKENAAKVKAVFGGFSQSSAADAWAKVATVRRIEGARDFLPRWPEELLVSHPPVQLEGRPLIP